MTPSDALAEWLVGTAVRRWPADARANVAREWSAELYVLRHEAGPHRLLRSYRQLRFAFSLATSRAAEPVGGAPRWRETVPGLVPVLVLLLAVPFAGGKIVQAGLAVSVRLVYAIGPAVPRRLRLEPVASAVAWSGVLVALAAVVLIGSSLGRRSRSVMAGRVLSLGLGVGIVAGDYLHDALSTVGLGGQVWYWRHVAVVGVGVAGWVVLVPRLLAVVRRLMAGGRRLAATAAAVAGGLVVADLSTALATLPVLIRAHENPVVSALWLPAVMAGQQSGVTVGPVLIDDQLLGLLPAMLLAGTAFAVSYGVHSALRANTMASDIDVATDEAVGTTAMQVRPTRSGDRVVGWATTMVGLVSWVGTVAVVSPAQRIRVATDYSEEQSQYLGWAHDLRQAAIVLLGVGLLLALSAHARALAAAAVGAGALLIIDIMLDVSQVPAATAGQASALAGLVAIASAWAFTRRAGAGPASPWGLTGAAVLAVYCGPAVLVRAGWTPPAGRPIPAGLVPATVIVVALLVTNAALCATAAAASAGESARPGRSASLLAAGVGLGAAVVAYASTLGNGSWAILDALLGPPLGLAMLAVVRAPGPGRPWVIRALQWSAAAAVSLVVAAPLLLACLLLPGFLGDRLPLSGDTFSDAYPMMPGAVIVGLLLAGPMAAFALRGRPRLAVGSTNPPEVPRTSAPLTGHAGDASA